MLHVGAGSGYYTALLARLVGERGRVFAYEIDPALAARAEANLADMPCVEVRARTGIAEDLPAVDAIYVNAGVTQPSWTWLSALKTGGKLLFPLQSPRAPGAILLVEKPLHGGLVWPARFISRCLFVALDGPQDTAIGLGLEAAFAGGGWEMVASLHLDDAPDDTCWFRTGWLSTADP